MSRPLRPTIVFYDVDRLLNTPRPPASQLAAALAALTEERITIVFCSHRTRAQVEGIRHETGVFHPFICENGAAVFVPDGYFGMELSESRAIGGYDAIEFARPYQHVVQLLYRTALRHHANVIGFSDMSVEAVARECGLTLLQARLAKLREYDEPFRLVHDDLQVERRLLRALEAAGLTCTLRGRYHFVGTAAGPGAAIRALTTLYRARFGAVFTVAAGGDAMRRRADVSFEASSNGDTQAWLDGVLQAVREIRARATTGTVQSY